MSQNPKGSEQPEIQPTLPDHNASANYQQGTQNNRENNNSNEPNSNNNQNAQQTNTESQNEVQQQNEHAFNTLDNIMEQNIEYPQSSHNLMSDNIDQQENPISGYANRIHELQQKQEILKYSVSDHQESNKKLFMQLYQKKKKLLKLVTEQYNSKQLRVDIGLYQEFQQLRNVIKKQEQKILLLRNQILQHNTSTISPNLANNLSNNERDAIMLRQKREQIQIQIQSGRRFAASQYVRDYLQRTYIHKVSYQDVKYEYEMKTKLKQYLRVEKQMYEKKRQELKRSIERQRIVKDELEQQKAKLQALVGSGSNLTNLGLNKTGSTSNNR